MKKSINIILFILAYMFSYNAYCGEYSVRPADLTEPAPLESNFLSDKKLDTTGGIYTCIKTSSWLKGTPIPKAPCTYGLTELPPEIAPSLNDLDNFRGPDVMNPCGSLRSKYANRYWDHDLGAYKSDDQGNGTFCKELQTLKTQLAGLDANSNYLLNSTTGIAMLDEFIPAAIAAEVANAQYNTKQSCYDKFAIFDKAIGTIGKDTAKDIDICMGFCDSTPPTVAAKNFCGVDACVADYKAGKQATEWCCSLASYWQSKYGVDYNPLSGVRDKCGVRETLQTCLRDFSSTSQASQECCKFSAEIQKYHPAAGKDFSRRCGSYNSSNYCLQKFDPKKPIDESCCALNYIYSGKIDTAPLMKNVDSVALNELKKKISSECKNYSVTSDPKISACIENLKKNKKLSPECCMAYHLGKLNPLTIGYTYSAIEKYCYPEKY
jgi:hypothetical protein